MQRGPRDVRKRQPATTGRDRDTRGRPVLSVPAELSLAPPESPCTSTRLWRWSGVLCALATSVAVVVWYLGLVAIRLSQGPVDNPMGIGIWFMVTSVFAIPAGILNATLVAPALARVVAARSWRGAPIIVHLLVFLASGGVFVAWTVLALAIPFLRFTGLLVFLYLLFGPAMIVGSLIYSICVWRPAARRQTMEGGHADAR